MLRILFLFCFSTTLALAEPWPVTTPARAGLDAAALATLHADIAAGKFGNADNLLVLRGGKIAFERRYRRDYDALHGAQGREESALNALDPSGPYNYFNPWWHPYYQRGELHTLQSVTKSVVALVIGTAVTRKEFPDLDTPVLKFFVAAKVANIDARKQRMTIRHLLTMTAGLDWDETLPYDDWKNTASQLEASFDWVKFTIDRPMSDEPGARFNYSSGVSQLLGHVFRVATGQDIEEYAQRHLFAPLGIRGHFWKRSPTGLADTEGGLYLRPHDLARLGELGLRRGTWKGRRVIDAQWLDALFAPAVRVRDGLDYGFQWWLRDGCRYAQGYGGQVLVVMPAQDIVAVFHAWNLDGDWNKFKPAAFCKLLAGAVRR